jgi:hypothetical protein
MIVAYTFLQPQLLPHREHLLTTTNINIEMYEGLYVEHLLISFIDFNQTGISWPEFHKNPQD